MSYHCVKVALPKTPVSIGELDKSPWNLLFSDLNSSCFLSLSSGTPALGESSWLSSGSTLADLCLSCAETRTYHSLCSLCSPKAQAHGEVFIYTPFTKMHLSLWQNRASAEMLGSRKKKAPFGKGKQTPIRFCIAVVFSGSVLDTSVQ